MLCDVRYENLTFATHVVGLHVVWFPYWVFVSLESSGSENLICTSTMALLARLGITRLLLTLPLLFKSFCFGAYEYFWVHCRNIICNSQTFSYFLPIWYPASSLRVAFLSLGLSIRMLLNALRHLGKRCDHHDSPDFKPQTAAIIKLSPNCLTLKPPNS